VNRSALSVALVPFGVLTITLTPPLPAPGGEVTAICVAEVTAKVAAVDPKCTAVAPVKLVPVIVTEVPPAGEPVLGAMPVTAGPGPAAAARVSELWVVTVTSITESRRTMMPAATLVLLMEAHAAAVHPERGRHLHRSWAAGL